MDAVVEVRGERRVVFGQTGDGVADGAGDGHPGAFGVATHRAESTAEADGVGEFSDQVVPVALCELGTGGVVAAERVLDVVVDLGESSPIGQAGLFVEDGQALASDSLGRRLGRGRCAVGGQGALLDCDEVADMELAPGLGEEAGEVTESLEVPCLSG